MSATDESIDRHVGVASLATLGAALGACSTAFLAGTPELSLVWAAAGRTLLERAGKPAGAASEAEVLLLDAADDPISPPWLVVDGLIALILEQVTVDGLPHVLVEVDRSLAGLRRLSSLLRHPIQRTT